MKLSKLQKGKIFILVDDKMKNEGDLVFSAKKLQQKKLILWLNMVED